MKESVIGIKFTNGKHIGNAILLEDGFYYFEFLGERGTWTSFGLKYISEKIDELNKDWSNSIEEYFKNAKPLDNFEQEVLNKTFEKSLKKTRKIRCNCPCHIKGNCIMHFIPCCVDGFVSI